MDERVLKLRKELKKIIRGKQEITDRILMAILARGHILLEDVPGVGKTTTALGFSKLMGMSFQRVQFTPDVVPSDITGFSVYDPASESFRYHQGAVMCNLLLAEEINRTSSKTQAALLEVMEEGKVTVDGVTRELPSPFVVIATQNPIGSAGTQKLPESQLDRFMVKLSMGYPDAVSQKELLRDRQEGNPLEEAPQVLNTDIVTEIQEQVRKVYVADSILEYITQLTQATRSRDSIALGISPRGALALCRMAKAAAYLDNRDYVTPKDVQMVFGDVCAHRLVLCTRARFQETTPSDILQEILKETPEPKVG